MGRETRLSRAATAVAVTETRQTQTPSILSGLTSENKTQEVRQQQNRAVHRLLSLGHCELHCHCVWKVDGQIYEGPINHSEEDTLPPVGTNGKNCS